MPWLILATLAWALAATGGGASEDGADGPAIGDRVAAFHATDIRYLPRSLDELPGERGRVLVFTTLECPIARRYVPALVELERDLRDVGVGLALVNVGAEDDMLAVATAMVEDGVGFPVLKDYDGSAARALGVTRTPEAVLVDADGRLRYRGRIDARHRFAGPTPAVVRADLKEAILDVLAGREVRVAETPVDGCVITPPRPPAPLDVTWAADVAPIVHRHCVECHRPRGEAPFSLARYEDVAKRARMIDEVVHQRRMPPWFASAAHGEFSNARGLSDEERRVVRGWVAAGAPPGDLAAAPPPPEPRVGPWEIGEPDLVVTQLGQTSLPADGYVPYQYVVLPHVFLSDTWVSDIEIRCDNEPVLHHANLAFVRVGERYRPDNFLTGKVPGGDPMVLDPGTAVLVPAGSVLGIQAHFVTTGRPEEAKLRVGLRFPRDRVVKRLYHRQITHTRFKIPPLAPDHEVRGRWTADQDITALGMFSHMHLRGRDMRFTAVLPDGAQETLLLVPNYSFDWQQSYRFPAGGRRFPAGTRIDVTAHFDNSAFNPYNPDPAAEVGFGLQTVHEMMYGFFFYFRDAEVLDLRVDPATGHVLAEESR